MNGSELVETHSAAREASLRRLKKSARKHMEAGLESQKVSDTGWRSLKFKIMAIINDLYPSPQLATDATTLIKHYRALLLA